LDSFDLQIRIPEDLPQVLFDPGLIEQVMYNIMDNAIKYSPANKKIDIKITFNELEVTISIHDQGTGITPGDLDKVFDKFYRTRSAASIAGSGLGLSICKGLIQAHHGRIWAEISQNNRGSIIHFTLPISKKEVVL
jgi:two-component system sensor histidine kinase KdpD